MSKEHINLPKTKFSMKANLPNKEPNYIEFWKKIDLYNLLRKKSKGKFPQLLKFSVTYPVPVKIEITLKETDIKLISVKLILTITR